MANAAGEQTRVVVWYAVWATICAAAAGLLVSLVHTWFFSYAPGHSAFVQTLVSDLIVALSIAAGQGRGAPLTGRSPPHPVRGPPGARLPGLVLLVLQLLVDFLPAQG